MVWSERFRSKGYKAFSYSLKAVGIGTLYLSLWGAFQVYHLIPAAAAFVAMAIVTGATIALALTQDAEILASFALIGGFATPVLLSTGQNHEVVLFSYVCRAGPRGACNGYRQALAAAVMGEFRRHDHFVCWVEHAVLHRGPAFHHRVFSRFVRARFSPRSRSRHDMNAPRDSPGLRLR